ncbi:MAG: hypothetical protein AAF614_21550 [Chloroflexota bacterium]
MSAENTKGSTQAFLDFNRADVWIGRLAQIIQTAAEWEDLAQELYNSTPRGKAVASGFVGDSSGFERDQLLSIKAALHHLGNFSKFIISRYTIGILPSANKEGEGSVADVHLLRAMLNHLSTDLALMQTALNQRQRLTKPNPKWLTRLYRQTVARPRGAPKQTPEQRQERFKENLEIYLSSQKTRTGHAETLLRADIMANYALAPAHQYLEHIVQGAAPKEETSPSTSSTIGLLAEGVPATITGKVAGESNDSSEEAKSPSIEVVTYFTENTRVRSLPYYPDIVLVGLPFATGHFEPTQLDDYFYKPKAFDQETDPILHLSPEKQPAFEATIPWEVLIIPHEIGHFVFWNGRIPDKKEKAGKMLEDVILKELTAPQAEGGLGLTTCDWRIHWLEELFCDVYNCLILGPMGNLGLQAIIADSDPKTLFHGGGDHPLGGIRPLIANDILAEVYPARFPNAIKQLESQWNHYLKSVGKDKKLGKTIKIGKRRKGGTHCWGNHAYRDYKRPFDRMQKVSLSLSELRTQLLPVIKIIHKHLKIEKPLFDRFSPIPDLPKDGNLQAFYPHVLQMTKGPFMGRAHNHEKRTINYAETKLLTNIKRMTNQELVAHLKQNYLTVWGDKGPEMDFMGG